MGVVDFQAPKHIAALGVPESMALDIVLRRALLDGHTSTMQLATALAVTPLLMESAVEYLRHESLLEVSGLEGRNLKLGVTELGRAQAIDRMSLCRYAGAVPVSLADYAQVVRGQHRQPKIHHDTIRAAFTDLVISDRLLDELGPAILAKGAIFLYGPPGTGKSSIAERLIRVHDDQVVVPRAVEVDGQIITVFDPVIHQPDRSPAQGPGPSLGALQAAERDRRWRAPGVPARPELRRRRRRSTPPRCRCRPTTGSS